MKTGDLGEEIVAKYMQAKGMEVLERNFLSRLGEIDIIAYDGEILVFTEVKTRKNRQYGSALEAINHDKLSKIIKTANFYMLKEGFSDIQIRIDAAEVYLEDREVNYLENIYPY